MNRYTTQHIDFLRTAYLSMKVRDVAKAFNDRFGMSKTESQIKATLKNHKIKCGRKHKDRLITRHRLFTEDQDQFIRENYTTQGVKELALLLKHCFKINKTPEQIKTYVQNHGIKSGRTGCFEKGNIPANKGTKGLTGANSGSFKKGNIPPNIKTIGTERICSKDGYILIKVAEHDPYTGFPTRYRQKHVYIWEQANGPVPKGMVVAFIDGDKTHCKLENLMLISRAELLALNQHGYKDMPDKLKPSVLAMSKLQVKTWQKEKKLNKKGMDP